MSRMRQVPVMDITLREKVMSRNLPSVPARSSMQPYRPRPRKMPLTKLRLSDTPALLSSGCSSVRELCSNVQHITSDLNQLISSIENILPLLTVYMTAIQTRSSDCIAADIPVRHCPEPQTFSNSHPVSEPAAPIHIDPEPSSVPVPPMPRPEDLQQLLDNPLVKNLMQSFMQGNFK